MTDSIGQRSMIKKSARHLGEAVDGAIQVETPGGVLSTMAFGVLGKVVVDGGGAARDAVSKNQPQEPVAEQVQLPRWAVLAVTPEAIHVLAASQLGRIAAGAADIVVPYADIAAVVIEERRLTTGFEVQLRSGAALRGETKRLGVNRHNTDLLRLVQERAATP